MKGYFSLIMAAVMLFSFSSCKKQVVSCISTSSNVVTVGETVDFSSCSVNGESYVWSFGDGTTSTESNPTHTYARVGEYVVTLSVLSKKDKKADEQTLSITVLPNSNNSSVYNTEEYRMTYIITTTEQRYDSGNNQPMADTTYNDTMVVARNFAFTENGDMLFLNLETITSSCNSFATTLSGDSFSAAAQTPFVCSISPVTNIGFGGLNGTFTESGAAVEYSYSFTRDLAPTNNGVKALNVTASGYRMY